MNVCAWFVDVCVSVCVCVRVLLMCASDIMCACLVDVYECICKCMFCRCV